MQASPKFVAFLKWWLTEAESIDPIRSIMTTGLCHATQIYARSELEKNMLKCELNYLLKASDLSRDYPFHPHDLAYYSSSENADQHTNPLRLAWVRKHLEEAEDVNSTST